MSTSFQNNGKLKLLIIVGTRPEIIRLSAVINKCRQYFDTVLAHTGQNYDYSLNGIFFRDLKLVAPEVSHWMPWVMILAQRSVISSTVPIS